MWFAWSFIYKLYKLWKRFFDSVTICFLFLVSRFCTEYWRYNNDVLFLWIIEYIPCQLSIVLENLLFKAECFEFIHGFTLASFFVLFSFFPHFSFLFDQRLIGYYGKCTKVYGKFIAWTSSKGYNHMLFQSKSWLMFISLHSVEFNISRRYGNGTCVDYKVCIWKWWDTYERFTSNLFYITAIVRNKLTAIGVSWLIIITVINFFSR